MRTITKVIPIAIAAAVCVMLIASLTPTATVVDNNHPNPATCVFKGQTYIFARGSDSHLYYMKQGDAKWQHLGGLLSSGPAVSATSDVMNIYVRGTDGFLYHKTTTDGWAFSGWDLAADGVLY